MKPLRASHYDTQLANTAFDEIVGLTAVLTYEIGTINICPGLYFRSFVVEVCFVSCIGGASIAQGEGNI